MHSENDETPGGNHSSRDDSLLWKISKRLKALTSIINVYMNLFPPYFFKYLAIIRFLVAQTQSNILRDRNASLHSPRSREENQAVRSEERRREILECKT